MNEFDHGILRQLFIDALPDYAVVLLDAEGIIQIWNSGARAILGYDQKEIIGKHFSCAYTKEDITSGTPSRVLAEAREMGRHDVVGRRVRKDGVEVEVQRVIIPLYNQMKVLVGYGAWGSVVTSPKTATASVQPMAAASRQGSEKILVVDDDEAVLEVASTQLKSLGYRVIAVANGAQALKMLAESPDVDLLFTDVSMPGGMGGREVADRALQIRPGLKVLFASGYFEGALVGKGDLQAEVNLLVKPYRKKDLAQKVKEVLSGTTS